MHIGIRSWTRMGRRRGEDMGRGRERAREGGEGRAIMIWGKCDRE